MHGMRVEAKGMIEACAACRFFEKDEPNAKHGECYRYPPLQGIVGPCHRPKVTTFDWCGEFKPLAEYAENSTPM